MSMDTVDTGDRPDLEAVLMGAVDQARAAIIEFSGEDTLGEYLGASFEDPTAATHRFLADMPGYRGWQWAVVVAACPGATRADCMLNHEVSAGLVPSHRVDCGSSQTSAQAGACPAGDRRW